MQEIWIVRILCPYNHQQRKQTGKPLQYTLTLLPAFLTPYSKIPVNRIEEAIDRFTQSPAVSAAEAAMIMGCENHKSFALYFNRAKQKIRHWVLLIIQMTALFGEHQRVNLENTLTNHQFSAQWILLRQLFHDYFKLYHKIPGTRAVLPEEYFSSIHSAFTQNQMGLGP